MSYHLLNLSVKIVFLTLTKNKHPFPQHGIPEAPTALIPYSTAYPHTSSSSAISSSVSPALSAASSALQLPDADLLGSHGEILSDDSLVLHNKHCQICSFTHDLFVKIATNGGNALARDSSQLLTVVDRVWREYKDWNEQKAKIDQQLFFEQERVERGQDKISDLSNQMKRTQDILTDYANEIKRLEDRVKTSEKEKDEERLKHLQLVEVLRAHLRSVRDGIMSWSVSGAT